MGGKVFGNDISMKSLPVDPGTDMENTLLYVVV